MPNKIRAAYYLRVSTDGQELENQRAEIRPFIELRSWELVCTFEDVVSGGKTEKDRPGFAAMLKSAHQRKSDLAQNTVELSVAPIARMQAFADAGKVPARSAEARPAERFISPLTFLQNLESPYSVRLDQVLKARAFYL